MDSLARRRLGAALLQHLAHDASTTESALRARLWIARRVSSIQAESSSCRRMQVRGQRARQRRHRTADAHRVSGFSRLASCFESDVGHGGGREIGTPVRLGVRLLGALVCRWPLDREPPPQASNLLALVSAIAAPRVEALIAGVREASIATTAVPELIGVSAAMSEVRRAIGRAARAPFSVMIEGESGVGQGTRRAGHPPSQRTSRAAVLRRELCGAAGGPARIRALRSREGRVHRRGRRQGRPVRGGGWRHALSGRGARHVARAQAKLLRVIQQQDVRRIGETFTRKVDVRVVAAANRDMRAEAAAKRFRADLLFRLDVIHLRLPPLRERPEDIPLLAQHFWRGRGAGRLPRHAHPCRAGGTVSLPWPGNVRELQNVMAALAVAAPARGRVYSRRFFRRRFPARGHDDSEAGGRTRAVRASVRGGGAGARRGSRTRAAAELGLSRQGLLKTMARLGLIWWLGCSGLPGRWVAASGRALAASRRRHRPV